MAGEYFGPDLYFPHDKSDVSACGDSVCLDLRTTYYFFICSPFFMHLSPFLGNHFLSSLKYIPQEFFYGKFTWPLFIRNPLHFLFLKGSLAVYTLSG